MHRSVFGLGDAAEEFDVDMIYSCMHLRVRVQEHGGQNNMEGPLVRATKRQLTQSTEAQGA